MVDIAHIKKFVEDHPLRFPKEYGQQILVQAEKLASPIPPRTINSEAVENLLGKRRARELFTLMGTDREYLQISADSIASARTENN